MVRFARAAVVWRVYESSPCSCSGAVVLCARPSHFLVIGSLPCGRLLRPPSCKGSVQQNAQSRSIVRLLHGRQHLSLAEPACGAMRDAYGPLR